MKVLANDGISNSGVEKLLNNGIDIKTITVEQGQLIDYINKNEITRIKPNDFEKLWSSIWV